MDAQKPNSESNAQLSALRLDKNTLSSSTHSPSHAWSAARLFATVFVIGGCIGGGIGAFMTFRTLEVKTQAIGIWYPSNALTVLTASGYVVPQRKASLASKATGRLEWLGVKEGDHIKAGQIIAKLDSQDTEANLKQAQAQTETQTLQIESARIQLHQIQTEYHRTAQLTQEGFMSQASLDDIQTRLKQAQATLEQAEKQAHIHQATEKIARVNLDYTTIRSPFDAIVLTKQANVGDIVTPFSSAADSKGAVITVADLSSLEIEADVNESAISKIYPDQPCEVILDAYPEQRFAGKVTHHVPTVDRSKATVMTKIRLLNPPATLLPDMSAKVSFLKTALPAHATPLLSVSKSALTAYTDNHATLWKVKENLATPAASNDKKTATLEAVTVTIHDTPEAQLVTLEPTPQLKSGDLIVMQPESSFKAGQRVKLLP